MYLSKLEIQGFKSFANRTVVNFTKGITGIVGPNGCGKTNIVDAIRWSLGEQKSSTLRSDKMEAVIFNGTRNKKPMGMAEVSLTLVNDDGVLPTEYSEVTITRRIFRSGESEYLLNRQICRLKDITNLFMDTGMSSNAYSVIELKMIETILSNKAEERRNMFEEAAGVNKYKLRRRLALRKLDEVKLDLTRVNDIVSEVEKKVRALERQAKKADSYNQINMVLKEKELDYAEREFSFFSNAQTENEIKTKGFSNRKNEIDAEISEIENELIVYRDQISEIEVELIAKRKEISKQTEKLHNVQKNISVAEERNRSHESNLVRFKQELEELQMQLEEAEESILINQDSITELEIDIENKSNEIEGSDEFLEGKNQLVLASKSNLKVQNDLIIERFKDINAKENELDNNTRSLNKITALIEKLNEKIQTVTGKIAKTVGYLEELNSEKDDAQNKLNKAEELLNSKQIEKEQLEQKLSELKDNELEEKSIMINLKNKVEFLQSLITNLEGFSKGSKTLIESNEWSDKEKTLFADVGNAEEKYRIAMEAALKFVINNLLIENIDELKKAISYLNENDLGKASFFLLQKQSEKKSLLEKITDFSLKRKIKKVEIEKGFLGWAHTFVKTSNKWKPYFEKVLSQTIITENLESALTLNKKYPAFNYATLSGDFVQSQGIIEAGSAPKLDETLFGRKQALENLQKELPKYEVNLGKLRELIEETEDKLSSIDLKAIADEGKIFSNELSNVEKQISQFEFEREKANEDVEKSRTELHEVVSESNTLNSKIEELSVNIEDEKKAREVEEEKLRALETEVKTAEQNYNNAIDEINQKKLELERLRGKKQNTVNAISRLEESKKTIAQSIEKREKDITNTQEEMVAIITILDDNQIEYDDIYEVQQQLTSEEFVINEKMLSLKREASKFEKELNQHRNERQTISDKLHHVDLDNNRIGLKLENLVQSIREDYSVELEIKEFEDNDTFNFEERSKEVSSLKIQLKNLGPINLLAYSEYEEEKERLEFLHSQRNDLIDSEKDLVKTIHEINETAQALFKDTFEQIRENFIKIFRTLFNPGDEADLVIQEGVDPLEAKIEIIAKPKGKRPTGIELLSGGEKTLTATALLFAIYLVKPSPFCILDEVDAPLDDANVSRYTRLISDFSKNTQFIMVTHNKRTMEAAENMYGVTMQEEGVSKLVGVQFNDDLKQIA
ncbi:MAG: chromosome segregation protein SMC [Melioribacteraceae bacterium]|nr:chromosome segregation protein SMC [Melioribacteraceae bacterium]